MTRAEIRTEVRTRISEPVVDRFILETEINSWINIELHTLSRGLKFLKIWKTFLGNTHVASLGTSPRYFDLPNDYLIADRNAPLLINGIRRLPTTDRELYDFQEKAVYESDSDSIEPNDYFDLSYTGLIFHYGIDYIFKDEMDASPARTGKLCWFDPNPTDTDSIKLKYAALHPDVTADTPPAAGSKIYLGKHIHELVVYGCCKRAAQKFVSAGYVQGAEMLITFEALYKEKYAEAEDYYDDTQKIPDKHFVIKTAKQLYGMYNSRARRGLIWGREG